METFHHIVLALVVLANGIAAGVLVGTLLGGFPLMRALPADRYVQAHAFFSTRYDPFMPACLLLTMLGDVLAVAVAPSTAAAALAGVGAAAAAGTVVISLSKNVPLNKWVQTVDPAAPPADWRDRRDVWGMWNRRRGLLVVIALVVNCAVIATLS
ncbi:anthrone oxygenase family protein [Nocardia sp. CDC153]|uniref:anthrone oxygenase family protein n=1 Tax=Nocardia sp. CDC153 TaxID=3112167 RepID=UPI002DC01941|nr:anthrone oxygenase family protein [Nocardia sp. CDC153]MEC3952022.1 anthrone oxygenase family protein [Nocardia sp. CDC153]